MGQIITIDDSNYLQFIDPVVDGEVKKCRTLPRDFSANPVGSFKFAKAFDLPLLDPDTIPERIAESEAKQSNLYYIRNHGMDGQRIPSRDQNGFGYCWAHSSVSASLLIRAQQHMPYADLSAFAVACIIKNYRDEGGWGAESVQFIADRGVPSSQFWPQKSTDRGNDNPQTWADAKKHRFQEWMDLDESGHNLHLQLATCLLLNIPVVVDFNWWSHSVCAIRLVNWDKASKTIRDLDIWNSWNDTWSDNGVGRLSGSKAIPNGALGCRVQTAA